jgi:hypothetical protein
MRPGRSPMAADAKILDEDEETGAKKYRYIRSGEDHFSLGETAPHAASRSGFRGGCRTGAGSPDRCNPRVPNGKVKSGVPAEGRGSAF